MITSVLFAVLVVIPSMQHPEPHAALTMTRSAFVSIWNKGLKDGSKRVNLTKSISVAERGIDRYHTSPFTKSVCSWAYFLHPRLLVYITAYKAASEYWDPAETEKAKQDLSRLVGNTMEILGFYVILQEMPSFDSLYGRLTRYANPANLTDIRCVLRVGKRIIQPLSQPGDLTISKSEEVNFYTLPVQTFIKGETDGRLNGTSYSWNETKSYTVIAHTEGSEKYDTYCGKFIVIFPVIAPDGTPIISAEENEIELIVVKKSAELKAKYSLKEWCRALER